MRFKVKETNKQPCKNRKNKQQIGAKNRNNIKEWLQVNRDVNLGTFCGVKSSKFRLTKGQLSSCMKAKL